MKVGADGEGAVSVSITRFGNDDIAPEKPYDDICTSFPRAIPVFDKLEDERLLLVDPSFTDFEGVGVYGL